MVDLLIIIKIIRKFIKVNVKSVNLKNPLLLLSKKDDDKKEK
jgi:hypothetical protein